MKKISDGKIEMVDWSYISTDMRFLKYKTDDLKMINPVDFVKELEECI
jgi:hypothetical protein